MIMVVLMSILLIMWIKNRMKPSKQEVLVSFTTSPTRIQHTKHLIETLSNQTVPPDRIIVNIPYIFKRTQQTFENIPDFMLNNPLVYINRCEDVGPATKVVPTVQLATSPDSIIISVDDDIEYRKNMVEILLKHSRKFPNSAITGESFMPGELVEGYSAVLYKRRFLEGFDPMSYPKFCTMADDFIISNFLRSKGIPIVVVSGEKPFGEIYLDYGSQADALKGGANGTSEGNIPNYKKCSEYLRDSGQLYISGKL